MNSLSQDLFALARNIGTQLPSLLTLLICLVIVLVRRKRHPKVTLIAALALVLLILHSLVFAVADVWLFRLFLDAGSENIDRFYAIFGLVASVCLAIAFAVLLIAIFIDRNRVAPNG
jgi:ABC-type Fe3+ transport system permease subunit